jgi:peptide/nickel transport system substrate-binding protein
MLPCSRSAPAGRNPGRRAWRLVGALLVAASIAACGTDDRARQPVDGGAIDPAATVRIAWSTVPTQLDPHRSTVEAVDFRVLNLVYDRLLTIEPDGSIGPMMATAWEYAPDGRSLTLTLREDVAFRDGTPLDADAVVINLERVLSLDSVVAARLANVAGVAAVAPHQVRIDLKNPTTELPSMLAQNAGMILNPTLLANGDPATTADGSGPYVVESFAPGTSLILTRAPDADRYWDPEAAKVARFEHSRIVDPRALTSALRAGQVDAAQLASPDQLTDVQVEVDRGSLAVTPVAAQGSVTLFLNRKVAPLDRLEVRQAINQALDRRALVDTFYPGSEPAAQMWRKSSPYFDSEIGDPYPFDPAAARQRLAAAGFPDGIDIGTVLVSNSLPGSLGEAVQAMLGDAGIRLQLQITDSAQIYAEYAKGIAPLMLNYTAGQGSAAATIDRLTGAAQNPAGRSPEFEALLTAANDNRMPEPEQDAAFRATTRYLAEQAWYAPILWISFPWVHSPQLSGLSMEEMDYSTTIGAYDWRYVGMRAND